MPVVILLSVVLSLAITVAVRRALLREVRDIGQAARDTITVKRRLWPWAAAFSVLAAAGGLVWALTK